jgi:lipopolysaccharide transport system permease protein
VSVIEYTPQHRIRHANLSGRVSTDISDLVHFRHLIWYMAMSSLAVESRGTKLGRSWWVVEPLLLMGVYTLLMRVIFPNHVANLPLLILASILAFEFFGRSVGRSMVMLQTTQVAMLHVGFPRSVVPLAVTLSEVIRFVVSVTALLAIAAVFGILPQPETALVVPFMLMNMLFTLGASYFFAASGMFFRDMTKITGYLFFILFQLGCGMIPLSIVAGNARNIVIYNPFTTFFEGVRAPVLYGTGPDIPFAVVGGVALLSILVLIGGYMYFLRREGSFSKVDL